VITGSYGNWKTIPWQVCFPDVSNAKGHQITIRVLAADCGEGAHGGYIYLDGDEGGISLNSKFLSFPLAGYKSFTAPISSVFDHNGNAQYDNNKIVEDFMGEIGDHGPYEGSTCYSKADGSAFGSGYNYVGTFGTGWKYYLCYDGHPGIDIPVIKNTPIYAAADGVAHIPSSFPGVSNAQQYNTVEIAHPNGYKTYYLHLSSQNITENQQVYKGKTIIGYSGDTGSPGALHLHFEVQKNGIPVDPYGWHGGGTDPYTRATNIDLWE
jgi:murein DD-endopeptidase MepM/ murein hydrolase activator NlpD